MKQNTTPRRGQPETENPANLNRLENDKRIKYPDNQPHAAATKTPKTR
ncbi:hypothetical protein A2U01_0073435, partial [Trifolium medium]|nr:hypothetical protein [Trifolium medium]